MFQTAGVIQKKFGIYYSVYFRQIHSECIIVNQEVYMLSNESKWIYKLFINHNKSSYNYAVLHYETSQLTFHIENK